MYTLLRASRPRFWMYVLGPFIIGMFAGAPSAAAFTNPLLWWFFAFFTLPANLFIYGVNDLFDGDTDAYNEKKQGYEQRAQPHDVRLIASILIITVLALSPIGQLPSAAQWGTVAFLFFGYFYSAYPLRAKARPFLDGIFNVLYIFPALVSFYLVGGQGASPLLFAAGWLWCMAMHAFSAIPDIAADRTAKLRTTATTLGATGTLRYCSVLYLIATALTFPTLGIFSLIIGLIYQYMLWQAGHGFRDGHDSKEANAQLFKVYKAFPLINGGIGFTISLLILMSRWPILKP